MAICPVCNGFENIEASCSSCGSRLEDSGRVMDFYDDYSAYMPIDQMKMEDGYPRDYQQEECPHLLKCPACGHDSVMFIKE
jgi:DNA-directed RNA polymerase subunit M/transcription elongation factor TFIIS